MKCEIKKVGTVGVDVGMILIADPSKIEDLPRYDKMLKQKSKYFPDEVKVLCRQIGEDWKSMVNCGGFGGDGIYPVYATICNGQVEKIEIRMKAKAK